MQPINFSLKIKPLQVVAKFVTKYLKCAEIQTIHIIPSLRIFLIA